MCYHSYSIEKQSQNKVVLSTLWVKASDKIAFAVSEGKVVLKRQVF
jgi:hypothetical protein